MEDKDSVVVISERVIIVTGGDNLSKDKLMELIKRQHIEDSYLTVIDNVIEEKPLFPEFTLENIKEYEEKQEKLFKPVSYQRQQRELRFLNKRKKK